MTVKVGGGVCRHQILLLLPRHSAACRRWPHRPRITAPPRGLPEKAVFRRHSPRAGSAHAGEKQEDTVTSHQATSPAAPDRGVMIPSSRGHPAPAPPLPTAPPPRDLPTVTARNSPSSPWKKPWGREAAGGSLQVGPCRWEVVRQKSRTPVSHLITKQRWIKGSVICPRQWTHLKMEIGK